MAIIKVEDLVKRYNGTEAVRGVSFEVMEGETFSFLGPNGAGKTTTINILCTLLGFDSGPALVNGYDCGRDAPQGLLHRPKVLSLDEPTLGLDPQTRSHVWEFIRKLKKSEGNTVFMTTHYMDEAEVSDRIAIIDRGQIIAFGSPDELKRGLKGDTIYLKTADDAKASSEIEAKFGLKQKRIEGGLALMGESG